MLGGWSDDHAVIHAVNCSVGNGFETKVALDQIAPEAVERLPARRGLDSFRNHLEIQRVPQVDCRPHNHVIVALCFELLDEGPVNLTSSTATASGRER